MWDFELVTLEKTTPPAAQKGGNWYRYIIANRITSVSGTRRGSHREVSQFVRGCIQRLNSRHLGIAAGQTIKP